MKQWSIFALAALCFATSALAEGIKGDPYSLNVCPVSGEELGAMGDPVLLNHEGRDIRLCCSACEPKFTADPAQFLAKIDKMMVEQQSKVYPLETCPISGQALTASAVDVIYNNRLVRFCCDNCPAAFAKDPETTLAKLDEAVIAKQAATFPFTKCLVSGDALDGSHGTVLNFVMANRLFKLCCDGCIDDLKADPAKFLAMVESGKMESAEGGEKHEGGHEHHEEKN